MAFNIPGIPFKLNAQDMGGFDLGGAIKSGLQNAAELQNARYRPSILSEQLLGSQLTNKINTAKAKYAEQLAQAQLAHQNALTEKAKRGPSPVLSNLEKAIAGSQRIKQQYGENSPQAKFADAYLQKISQGSQGISISTDPETGQPLVQIGGGVGRSQGGKILQNPATGEAYIQPTGAVATSLQNKIIGEEQLEPIMQDIINTVPQFQSGWTRLKKNVQGGLNQWAGTDYRLPSVAAKGKSSLSKSAESLVKLYGLNATSHNVEEVKNILTPGEGESAEGYKQRVKDELSNFAESKKVTKGQLSKGVKVFEGNKPTSSNNEVIVEWTRDANGKPVRKS